LPADWTERFNGGFRIESQTLGVLSDYRGLRIANLLKKRQAELAWREGVGVVSWTADPLQAPNAALNFGLLKAVAFEFAPDLYPFRNELNRVHASRFGLTWLVGSKRVRDTPAIGARADILDLRATPADPRANDGPAARI
jgi:predicted GNAT superfamily acetyltransferase